MHMNVNECLALFGQVRLNCKQHKVEKNMQKQIQIYCLNQTNDWQEWSTKTIQKKKQLVGLIDGSAASLKLVR